MNEHRLGIIGGMGPQATNTFYQYIICLLYTSDAADDRITSTAPTPAATRSTSTP